MAGFIMTSPILWEFSESIQLDELGQPKHLLPLLKLGQLHVLPSPSCNCRCHTSVDKCRLTWSNISVKGAHKCRLIRGSNLYQRVIKFFFMRIKWAFTPACCTAACLKLEMKSKWKRFNQIIHLRKISSTANVFLMWYCATQREER